MLLCILTGNWQKLADLAVAYYNEEEGEEMATRSSGTGSGSGAANSAADIEGISKSGETNIYEAAEAPGASRPVSPEIVLQPKQPRPKSGSGEAEAAAAGGGAGGGGAGSTSKHGARNDGIRAAEPPTEKDE